MAATAYPSARPGGQYHFARPTPRRPGCPLVTRCSGAAVRRPALGRPAAEVPPELRCQSKGCRQHWPEDTATPTREEHAHG